MSFVSKITFALRRIPSFLIILVIPFSVYANENEGGMWKSCKPDVEKFCKEVKPGEGRILRCLKENHENLSGECKQQMAAGMEKMKEKMVDKMKEARETCKEDIEEFCKEVQPGEGRMMQCLKKHEEHISKKCQNALQEHQDKMHDMKEMKERQEKE